MIRRRAPAIIAVARARALTATRLGADTVFVLVASCRGDTGGCEILQAGAAALRATATVGPCMRTSTRPRSRPWPVDDAVRGQSGKHRLDNVPLCVLVRVTIEEPISASCGDGRCEDALALLTRPAAWLLANTPGLSGSGSQRCLDSLSNPVLALVMMFAVSATGWRGR